MGAENRFANRGGNTYFNGIRTLPADGDQLAVASAPCTTSSRVITIDAKGVATRQWRNCSKVNANIFIGTSVSCFSGRPVAGSCHSVRASGSHVGLELREREAHGGHPHKESAVRSLLDCRRSHGSFAG